MNNQPTFVSAARFSAALKRISPYILMALAIALAWQVVIQPLKQRAPVTLAIRVAPNSPLVLRRAAETEFAAGRTDNAAALARESLLRSPFNVQALRMVGLSEAEDARTAVADDILTLASNWSLRDDPTQAWLVEARLRRGDYSSAFAHADTLVRRRVDIQPAVFRLFTAAGTNDAEHSLPVIAKLLTANPPWRRAYLTSLYRSPEGFQVAINLAISLQHGAAPMTTAELQELYLQLMEAGQVEAVKLVRTRLNRPSAGNVSNGGFENPEVPEPFQWRLVQTSGASAAAAADDLHRHGTSLRVEYDGYSPEIFARQRIFLEPGTYRLSLRSRIEAGSPFGRMIWSVSCAEDNTRMLALPAVTHASRSQTSWVMQAGNFLIPQGCTNQWLELLGQPLDSRATMVVWFDTVSIERSA